MTSTSTKSFLFLLAFFAQAVHSQNPPNAGEPVPKDRNIVFEAVPMFGEDTSKAYVAFHYRINKNYFVFVKNQKNTTQEEYVARGELMIELLNEEGVSVGREIRTVNLTRATLPSTGEPPSEIQGAVMFTVPDGTLNIVFEVDDKESGRTFVERKQKVTTRRPILRPLESSIPFFVEMRGQEGTSKFIVSNRGSDVVFGSRGGYLIQMYLPTGGEGLHVSWNIEGRLEDRQQEKVELEGTQYTLLSGFPQLASSENEIIYEAKPTTLAWNVLFIPLPLEKLFPGSYQLQIEFKMGETTIPVKRSLRVYWPQKPVSLTLFDLSVDALRIIAKEEEIDEMYGFTTYRGYLRFMEFWKKRDPDTTTAYNEVMAEFYRRVDESIRRFSSLKENDGYKTDRGRIFVLYGTPTTTERRLLPNRTPTEVWTYQNIRRKFIFTDPSRNGSYILTETETL
jgi:GWxTD domain-containing protein